MSGKTSPIDSIVNKDWYKFTNEINKVVHEISTVPYYKGWLTVPIGEGILLKGNTFTIGNISQIVHWERNAFNRAPKKQQKKLNALLIYATVFSLNISIVCSLLFFYNFIN